MSMLFRISTIFREFCRKVAQSRGGLVKPCLQQRRSLRRRSSSSVQMITMARRASKLSMNMWGLTPDFLTTLEDGFKEFFKKEVPGNPLKAEYLIPIFIGELLEQEKMSVKVLKTNDTWYGMTYHEDVAAVKESFKKMLENGVYKADLFSDL